MYFLAGDVTIVSQHGLAETAIAIATALEIPPFVMDDSGRWEEQEVLLAHCFGLEFVFGQPLGEPTDQYGLSIMSNTDLVNYDGREQEVDVAAYVIALLKRDPSLHVIAWHPSEERK